MSKLSGVSITTVSRVLNGTENVSDETKARVEEVIAKHDYTPRQGSRNFHRKTQFAVPVQTALSLRQTWILTILPSTKCPW
ncbi:MAG: LacI family DNA-binding transcriptional regulator [Eubacteriales bacterium]